MVFVWVNNTSAFSRDQRPLKVLAHRGVTQTTSVDLGNDGCFARNLDQPRHGYVENTIASMREAIRLGADGFEIDVQPTTDGEFVVFHDWTLDCATNGHGVTRTSDSRTIRALDPAYYYTADGGLTYPFRGRWTGQIPLLSEVLSTFPDQLILINVKSDDPVEGERLARYLSDRGQATGRIAVFGGEAPVQRLRALVPEVRSTGNKAAVDDLVRYELVGWTGHVPGAVRGGIVGVPLDQAHWIWGWPARFSQRMSDADTLVLLVASTKRADRGFNDPAQLAAIPRGATGFVVTDEVGAVVAELERLGRR